MRHLCLPAAVAACFLLTAPATTAADTLLLDSVDQARAISGSQPARGMTMQQVEARYGTPVQRRAAVGSPPITRWEYAEFIVYFEHRHVIHSVRKRS